MNSKEILPGMIVIRLNTVGQLFNTMDASPFHERDLDHDAEEFIVSSAREIHAEAPLRIRIELAEEPRPGSADMVRESLGNFFRYWTSTCIAGGPSAGRWPCSKGFPSAPWRCSRSDGDLLRLFYEGLLT